MDRPIRPPARAFAHGPGDVRSHRRSGRTWRATGVGSPSRPRPRLEGAFPMTEGERAAHLRVSLRRTLAALVIVEAALGGAIAAFAAWRSS
jgi:hypothetical protein